MKLSVRAIELYFAISNKSGGKGTFTNCTPNAFGNLFEKGYLRYDSNS
jgi:hypothetical protein